MDQLNETLRLYWKPILAAFFVLAMVLLFRGCVKEEKVAPAQPTPSAKKVSGNYIPYTRPADASPITGESCANHAKRTYGVMFNGDRGSRQYFSNLSQADFIAEIPHRMGHGQPRILAVYGCNMPETVGPMRSGRVDHINVAASLDAVYVPWGGSSVAKALLKRGGIDQLDCNGEIAPGGGAACFRRTGPMNTLEKASVNLPKLASVAQANNYRSTTNFKGFDHQGELAVAQRPGYSKIFVKYDDPYRVEYEYDSQTNSYKRFFQGKPDIDYETKQQYAPKNLITIITKKEAWYAEEDYVGKGLDDPWAGVAESNRKRDSGQYPNMQLGDAWFDTKFEGEARFFFNGQDVKGTWKKADAPDAKFEFFDRAGAPIHFVPGQIWMHVLEHDRKVSHDSEEEYLEKQAEQQAGVQ